MITQEALAHRRTAGSVRRAMASLRAARSWFGARVLAKTHAREASSVRLGQMPSRGDAADGTKPRLLRPVIVPASLDELHGPSAGIVTPPRRLWWSGEEGTAFDLTNRAQAAELYEAIFEAARSYRDITDNIDAELLVALWPDLGMRRATRQAWEAAHPILAVAAASIHVA